MINFRSVLLAGLLVSSVALGAEQIVLKDGSRINGKVISMQGGTYQVQTPSMGIISLKQSQVQSISQGGVPDAAPSEPAFQAGQSAVQSLQSSMSADQGLMSSILQLQSDPDMQAVLNDPEVMRAVQTFDLDALTSNPKIQKLMNNHKVQSIQQRVQP